MKLTEEIIKQSYTRALTQIKNNEYRKDRSASDLLLEKNTNIADVQVELSTESINECCSPSPNVIETYKTRKDPRETQNISFGCIRLNKLLEKYVQPGNTVIDFGSGPGHDLFMAARLVGKNGKAIGIDFTDVMIEEVRSIADKEKLTQVELVKASIDDVPLPDNTADIIISNCVINLTFNKQEVFNEAFRLLKPGGILIDADVISDKPLSREIQNNNELWCSCVGGALTTSEYRKKLKKSGFHNISTELGNKNSVIFDAKQFGLFSGVIIATKPTQLKTKMSHFSIKKSCSSEFEDIKTLLRENSLPVEGIEVHFENFFCIKVDFKIIACIGLEIYDSIGLLRSLVVHRKFRSQFLAKTLISEANKYAKEKKLQEIYLITLTAREYFVKFGFEVIDRLSVPPAIKNSVLFSKVCPSSSFVMKLVLA